ncbi:MAG TPA: hypothetical protein VH062_06695 [Polyangiaceae bacterium]|jgi:hypothetical protein|nr:hypothetical protein [Polyangiaceae bacterium]
MATVALAGGCSSGTSSQAGSGGAHSGAGGGVSSAGGHSGNTALDGSVSSAGGNTTLDGSVSSGGGTPSTRRDAGGADFDAPFTRPDAAPYTAQKGTCGFDAPAFCDTFETGPANGGRSGELDPAKWSVTRGQPYNPASLTDAIGIGPALLPACRTNLPARAVADSDALICDPTAGVPSRHFLAVAAEQNYGLETYRIRQPFDFAGRTGTLKFDVSLENNGLGGWPAISISQAPSPAPSFDWEERGSGPQKGLEIEFNGGWCNGKHTVEAGLFAFADYAQTAARPSFDCATPHASTSRDALNHVEVYLTARHLEVWASDPSPDGVTFPNFHMLYSAELNLPFERGSVNLIVRNHATMKYWVGSAWTVRWDNVGFDGPIVTGFREYDVPDSLSVTKGLSGCLMGGVCRWRGDVIAENPDDDTLCDPDVTCTADGEGRNVGYVVPRDDEPAPATLHIPGVDPTGATRAELVFAASYPWFDWNGVSKPPTAINLQYRLNGGAFHDRFITATEATAFTDFNPDIGGAGHGAGFLNQVVALDPGELKSGDNVLELRTAGTWTGDYRAVVTGVDLLLTTSN